MQPTLTPGQLSLNLSFLIYESGKTLALRMRLNKMSGKGSAHDPVWPRARVSVCWGLGWGAAAGRVYSATSGPKELHVLEDSHRRRPGRTRRSQACSLHFRSVSASVCCWYWEDKRLGCCCAHLGKKPRLGCEPQAPVQMPNMRSFLCEAACIPTGIKGGEKSFVLSGSACF